MSVAEPPPAGGQVNFPLDLAMIDPESSEKKPPYLVMFETGVDQNDKDVRGPLGRLEALRGPSKMFPESNKDDGLPVVLRGLRFHRLLRSDGTLEGYEVELQGEFNMVKVPVNAGEMKKFLSGERVSFSLTGRANYGVYAYASAIKMEVQLRGAELFIYKVDGDFSFREGFTTYTSKTKKLSPPAGRDYIYRGETGQLPALPSI
ncbi:MAG TPA: hypothetical protein VFB80_04110 [Pirellulaceae bacterium]|nr:hypothetical protein [Pirellulaceae bacterium]